jgi:two-component system sensor histidine kinase/response regulator
LDVERGLTIALGRMPLYLKLLDMFLRSHGTDIEGLVALAARKDQTALHDRVHALKGAAGNIGAVAVQAQADAVMRALRSGANPERDCRVLAERLTALTDHLRRAIGSGP